MWIKGVELIGNEMKNAYRIGRAVLIHGSSIATIGWVLAGSQGAFAQAPATGPTQDPVPAVTLSQPQPGAATSPFITVDAPSAEDQDLIDVSQTSKNAPALLAKTGAGAPLANRLFLRQSVPDSGNYFTQNASATYVDGVYYNKPYGALYDFIDIQQIDLLPTAQGTLFGRNTIDGATLITTRQPNSNQFGFDGDVAYGSYNWFDVRGAVNIPVVTNKVALSVSGLSRSRDGLVEDSALNEKVNNRDYQAGRVKLLVTPSDDFDLTLTADGLNDRSSPKYLSSLSPFAKGQDAAASPSRDIFTSEAVTPDLNNTNQEGASIVGNYRLSDALALKSISSFHDINTTNYVSYDATPANTLSTETFARQSEFTEDDSLHAGNDWLQGVGGLFYLRRDTTQWTPTGGSPNWSREIKNSYAAYGNLTAKLNDNVDIVAGARYTDEHGDFTSWFFAGNKKATLANGKTSAIPGSLTPPQDDSQTGSGFTPRLGVNVHITSDLLVYAGYDKGYKAGGWNNRLPPNYNAENVIVLAPQRYLPEHVDQYEIGTKLGLFDNALQFNASAYIHNYTNLEVPVLLYNASTSYLLSAPQAQINGAEFDASWRATSEIQLYGTLTAQHGNYQTAFNCQNTAGVTVDCQNNPLIGLAKFKALGGIVYAPTLPILGQLRFNFSGNYSDQYQNSVANDPLAITKAHTLYDASINYDLPETHLTFSLEGRNLTDVHWFSTAYQSGPSVAVLEDDPRMIIFRVRYKY
jgi:iron complex outermembrane receptor protein